MKRTLSLLLALVLALSCVFALASCGACDAHVDANYDEVCDVCEAQVPYTPEYLGFEGIYNTDYEEDKKIVYSSATLLDALNDMSQSSSTGSLRIFKNTSAKSGEKKLAVLNTKTGSVVLTINKEEVDAKVTSEATLTSEGSETFILVTTTNTTDKAHTSYTYKLYTALGAEISSKTTKAYMGGFEVNYEGRNLYEIDGKIYFIKDSVATFKYDAALGNVPGYDVVTDKYNYVFADAAAYVFDQANKIVATWNVPTGAKSEFYVLANGNLFVQYVTALPFDAIEYDYYKTTSGYISTKYDVTSLIFDVEAKTEKALELDYVVEDIINELSYAEEFAETFAKDKLTNVVIYYSIVDKMLNESIPVYADMTNDMFTIGYLAKEITAQQGFAYLVADNRYVVENEAGQVYLLNEKGEVIGEITNADLYSIPGYIVNGYKLYDFNLNVVLDASNISYAYVDGYDGYAIYRDTAYDAEDNATYTYYLFSGASMSKLTLPKGADDFDCYSNYFTYTYEETVDSVTKQYKVYCNTNGEKIKTVELNINASYSVISSGNVFVLKVTTYEDSTTTVRYYVAK